MLKVLKFSSSWCSPCRVMKRVWDEVVGMGLKDVEYEEIDVDEQPDRTIKFEIRSIPTLIFMRGEDVIDTVVGSTTTPKFVALIKKHSEVQDG